jgi:hypothetical protein
VKKYLVELSAEQREELLHMISTGKAAARELTHARILLKAGSSAHRDRAGAMAVFRKP